MTDAFRKMSKLAKHMSVITSHLLIPPEHLRMIGKVEAFHARAKACGFTRKEADALLQARVNQAAEHPWMSISDAYDLAISDLGKRR